MKTWNQLTHQEKVALQSLLGTAIVVGLKHQRNRKRLKQQSHNLKQLAQIYANLVEFRTYVDDMLVDMEFDNMILHMKD